MAQEPCTPTSLLGSKKESQPTNTSSLEASRWESASPLVPGGTAFGPNAQVSAIKAASLASQVEPLRLAAASWLLAPQAPLPKEGRGAMSFSQNLFKIACPQSASNLKNVQLNYRLPGSAV